MRLRKEGEAEEGRYSLEGSLEEMALKGRVGEDLDGRRVMGAF